MLDDFMADALARSQTEFAGIYTFPFLVGAVTTRPVTGPTQTMRGDDSSTIDLNPATGERMRVPAGHRLVLPVRKIQGSFPSMITVGRTKNNDVVLADPRVSKFHAYFRVHDGAWELADAGSVNGTRIGDLVLAPKGSPQPVHFGDRITFGELALTFLDPTTAWQTLRTRR
jgi:FHA domain